MKRLGRIFMLSACAVAVALVWLVTKIENQKQGGSVLGFSGVPQASADVYDPSACDGSSGGIPGGDGTGGDGTGGGGGCM